MENDNELASQVKSWYDIDSFGAHKQLHSRSAVDLSAHETLENTTVYNGLRYDVGMLWAADNTKLPNNYFSSLVILRSLKKPQESRMKNCTSTINEDLNKGYVIEVSDAQEVENRSDQEWYLPHHPVLSPRKPGDAQ